MKVSSRRRSKSSPRWSTRKLPSRCRFRGRRNPSTRTRLVDPSKVCIAPQRACQSIHASSIPYRKSGNCCSSSRHRQSYLRHCKLFWHFQCMKMQPSRLDCVAALLPSKYCRRCDAYQFFIKVLDRLRSLFLPSSRAFLFLPLCTIACSFHIFCFGQICFTICKGLVVSETRLSAQIRAIRDHELCGGDRPLW